jgi:halocyanin-like protein
MQRRRFLRTDAATTVDGSLLAGCTDRFEGDDAEETLPGEEFPGVDEWLTETEVGGADETYEGVLLDRRDSDEVRVDVGVDGNGGAYAYDPSAVAVSPGTTVRWVWVDDREGHSVAATPDRQLGESDYEFSSGGPFAEEGYEFEQTLDREGVVLYHCEGIAQGHWERRGTRLGGVGGRRGGALLHLEPHRQLGMKGAVAVTE